jgi:hypothetical protein
MRIYTTEQVEVLRKAAKTLKEHDRLKAALREQQERLSDVSREYGIAFRVCGFRPEHVRQACVARGLIT